MTSRTRRINFYYASRVYADREGYEILSWSSREAQRERFQVLLEIMRWSFPPGFYPSLLDVGCGLAELAIFLENAHFPVRYTGIDLTEEVLAEGRKRNPGLDLRLLDVFRSPCPFAEQSYDIVYASGIFNMELGNNDAFAVFGMQRLSCLARRLAVANFLHCRSLLQHSVCHYFDPDLLISQLSAEGVPVTLFDQYLDNDFTLAFRREIPY